MMSILFIGCMLTGLLAGVMAGLFGVGGGIVIVPALLFLFWSDGITPAFSMQLAVGTSLATIIVTNIYATWSHHQRKAVAWTEVAVTYNAGRAGDEVRGTALASKHPQNRGAMSQRGAVCLAGQGLDAPAILRHFYGDDVEVFVRSGYWRSQQFIGHWRRYHVGAGVELGGRDADPPCSGQRFGHWRGHFRGRGGGFHPGWLEYRHPAAG